MRTLLSRFQVLDILNRARLTRPWLRLERDDGNEIENLSRCYMGAVPHYRTGIGHILAEWNTGLLWSHNLGLRFAHCQLREPWNDFFGLDGFDNFQEISDRREIRRVLLPLIPSTASPEKSPLISRIIRHHAAKGPCLFQLYYGQNSYRQDQTSRILREKYFSKRLVAPIPDCRTPGVINISVHVRRRNAEDMSNPTVHDPCGSAYKARYRDDEFFLRICLDIAKALGSHNVKFNIFSQGAKSSFREYACLPNVSFRLDEDVLQTFHNIVMGDILLLSPSSFSFKAGMISKGVKLAAEPWWHYIPDDSEWCRLGVDLEANTDKICRFLSKANLGRP